MEYSRQAMRTHLDGLLPKPDAGRARSPLRAVTLTNAFEYLCFCSFHRRAGDCAPYLFAIAPN